MGKLGFDNDKYLSMQSEHIRERISLFGGKLYLEFGGKLFDDYHASRVLPGFQPPGLSVNACSVFISTSSVWLSIRFSSV